MSAPAGRPAGPSAGSRSPSGPSVWRTLLDQAVSAASVVLPPVDDESLWSQAATALWTASTPVAKDPPESVQHWTWDGGATATAALIVRALGPPLGDLPRRRQVVGFALAVQAGQRRQAESMIGPMSASTEGPASFESVVQEWARSRRTDVPAPLLPTLAAFDWADAVWTADLTVRLQRNPTRLRHADRWVEARRRLMRKVSSVLFLRAFPLVSGSDLRQLAEVLAARVESGHAGRRRWARHLVHASADAAPFTPRMVGAVSAALWIQHEWSGTAQLPPPAPDTATGLEPADRHQLRTLGMIWKLVSLGSIPTDDREEAPRPRVQRWIQQMRETGAAVGEELAETGELAALVGRRMTGEHWTSEEQSIVRAQLLDLARIVPTLAVFAAPGGSLLLPILTRILPFDLRPSAFRKPAPPSGDDR